MKIAIKYTLPIACVICLDPVTEPMTCPSHHVFCRKCIMEWIAINPTCPSCRSTLSKETLFPLLGGVSSHKTSGQPVDGWSGFDTDGEGEDRLSSLKHKRDLRNCRIQRIMAEFESDMHAMEVEIRRLRQELMELRTTLPPPPPATNVDHLNMEGDNLMEEIQALKLENAALRSQVTLSSSRISVGTNTSNEIDLHSGMSSGSSLITPFSSPKSSSRHHLVNLSAKSSPNSYRLSLLERENVRLRNALEANDRFIEDGMRKLQKEILEGLNGITAQGQESLTTLRSLWGQWQQFTLDNSSEHVSH